MGGKGGQEREERQRGIKVGKDGGWLKRVEKGEPEKSRENGK